MIVPFAGTLLAGLSMMWLVHVALEHTDWRVLAAAIGFGIGAFLMGAR